MQARVTAFLVGLAMAVLSVFTTNETLLDLIKSGLLVVVPLVVAAIAPTLDQLKERNKLIAAVILYVEDQLRNASNQEKENKAVELFREVSKERGLGLLSRLGVRNAIRNRVGAVKRTATGEIRGLVD